MAATLLLFAASIALVACGKSAHLPASATATRAQPARKAAGGGDLAITKTHATALAKALNLRASDLPGFHRNSEHAGSTSHSEKALEQEARKCMGGKEVAPLAEAGSHTFERKAQVFSVSVSSTVEIASTPARALAELNVVRSSRARDCLKAFVQRLLAQQSKNGASAKVVSITKGTPPAPGASGSFGWRITGTISLHGVKIPLYMDLLGFDYKQALVSLFSFGLPLPFPPRAEDQLFSLLLERAKAGGAGTLGKPGKTPQQSGPRQVQISL